MPVAGKVVPLLLNPNHLICSSAGKSRKKKKKGKRKAVL